MALRRLSIIRTWCGVARPVEDGGWRGLSRALAIYPRGEHHAAAALFLRAEDHSRNRVIAGRKPEVIVRR